MSNGYTFVGSGEVVIVDENGKELFKGEATLNDVVEVYNSMKNKEEQHKMNDMLLRKLINYVEENKDEVDCGQ